MSSIEKPAPVADVRSKLAEAIGLFPTYVFRHEVIESSVVSTLADALHGRRQRDLEESGTTPEASVDGTTHQTSTDLHLDAEFAALEPIFTEAAHRHLREQWLRVPALRITECWANLRRDGTLHGSHSHPNSMLSAVLYLRAPDGTNPISFYDPRPQSNLWWPDRIADHPVNSHTVSLAVTTGMLLTFPSWLMHAVPPAAATTEDRISVAANLIPDGTVGSPTFRTRF